MNTQTNHLQPSSQINQGNSSNIERYLLKDEQGHLIGKVEKIYRDDQGLIQIIFSLLNTTGKPLFRVDEKCIQEADLENRTFIIKLTPLMRENLNKSLNLNSLSSSPISSKVKEVDSLPPSKKESEMIRLLGERLVVDRNRRKVGEVVVRKEIETEIIEVPVKREKLIVEKVGDQPETLAEVDLSSEDFNGVEQMEKTSASSQERVTGEFISLKAASELLRAISLEEPHGCTKVRLELVLNHPKYKEKYKAMFDRCTNPL